jgi:hypothetical protein
MIADDASLVLRWNHKVQGQAGVEDSGVELCVLVEGTGDYLLEVTQCRVIGGDVHEGEHVDLVGGVIERCRLKIGSCKVQTTLGSTRVALLRLKIEK